MPKDAIFLTETSIEKIHALLEQYKKQIAIPYDDFLEDYILRSRFYAIEVGAAQCGFFGLHDRLLTALYIDDLHFSSGNSIFAQIRAQFAPNEAFIPTTDIAALAIILESYQKIEIQALHFSDSGKAVRPAEFGKEQFRPAQAADIAEIEAIADDFLDDYAAKAAAGELFVLEQGAEILGIGVLVRNKIMDNCIGTGMLTKADKRGQGIGRSIILHLKELVYGMGMIPVPGCWYYNINSRRTLESAGYITKSKLLRITL